MCCVAISDPNLFSPGDRVRYHSRTLGAHVLATVVGPSPNGPQFCHIRYIRPGGVTPVDHERTQLSRLCWVNHIGTASTQKSLQMCSLCLHQWRVPQFALKYPCTPPPPPGRPLRANVGGCKGGGGYSAPNAPKLVCTVILWYSFVVQSPPPRAGGDHHGIGGVITGGG